MLRGIDMTLVVLEFICSFKHFVQSINVDLLLEYIEVALWPG